MNLRLSHVNSLEQTAVAPQSSQSSEPRTPLRPSPHPNQRPPRQDQQSTPLKVETGPNSPPLCALNEKKDSLRFVFPQRQSISKTIRPNQGVRPPRCQYRLVPGTDPDQIHLLEDQCR